jgi:drug/metabolite transporter (DMT)-like permease
MSWFYLALLTPIISALAVIISKNVLKNIRAGVLMWFVFLFSNIVVVYFAFKDPLPKINYLFFIGILGSALFYCLTKIMSYKAIRGADLSLVYPLVALGPIFTLFLAMLPPVSEFPSLLAFSGIIISLFGCYILNLSSINQGIFKPLKAIYDNKNSWLMFWSVAIGSVVIVFDKLAINNTFPKSPALVLLMESIPISLGLLPIIYK